jgi:hypothetical protein
MLTLLKLVLVFVTLAMGFFAASAFVTGQSLLGMGWLLVAFVLILVFTQLF